MDWACLPSRADRDPAFSFAARCLSSPRSCLLLSLGSMLDCACLPATQHRNALLVKMLHPLKETERGRVEREMPSRGASD